MRRTAVPPAVVPCDCCPNRLMESEAAGSRRALSGAVLCWRCRRRQYPAFTPVHQLPAGCAALVRPTGYGQYVCDLATPAGTFQGGGWTDELALSRARAAATLAGAL